MLCSCVVSICVYLSLLRYVLCCSEHVLKSQLKVVCCLFNICLFNLCLIDYVRYVVCFGSFVVLCARVYVLCLLCFFGLLNM